MLILDTNVVSESMNPRCSSDVRDWLDRQLPETLYLTTTSLAELLLGIALLPKGKRKHQMGLALEEALELLVGPRIIGFDKQAAGAYARLVSHASAGGYTISVPDGQIAAVAEVHSFTVVTRDTGPYLAAGLPVINPWES